MSRKRITAAARVQRLLALLQWAAAQPEGASVEDACERFRLTPAELAQELELASMIGADSVHYDDMPFEVFVEDGLLFVRLFSFRRPMRLTPAEGLALVAAAQVLADAGPDEGDDPGPLRRALGKLAAALGIEPGDALDIAIDPEGGELGRSLRAAIDAGRRVSFTYWTYGSDQVARRTVEPWSLQSEQGAWYLFGHSVDAGAERTFRLDRMADLEVLDDARERPVPRAGGPVVDISADGPKVVLDLSPAARWVAEAHPVLAVEPGADDHVRVTLAVSGRSFVERLLVSLGPDATVVEIAPELGGPSLRSEAARRTLERYQVRKAGADGPLGSPE